MGSPRISDEKRIAIANLLGTGISDRKIAMIVGCAETTVRRYRRLLSTTQGGRVAPSTSIELGGAAAFGESIARARQAFGKGVLPTCDSSFSTCDSAGSTRDNRHKRRKENTRNPEEEEDKPPLTHRRWDWEHSDDDGKTWIKRPGLWFNTILGKWVKGPPPEHHRIFWWTMEFLWHARRWGRGTHPFGQIHKEISAPLGDPTIHLLLVLIARGHLKSTFGGECFGTYTILEEEDIGKAGIMIITWADTIALRTYTNIIDNLAHNKKILNFYGYVIQDEALVKGKGKKKKFTESECYFRYQEPGVGQAGLLVATFQSGKITGFHPALVICDDILDEAMTDAFRNRFKTVIIDKILPAADKGRVIFIGTYKGYTTKDDVYLFLKQNQLYMVVEYPAILDRESKQPAMPEWDDIDYSVEYIPMRDATGKVLLKRDGTVQRKPVFTIHAIKDEDRYEVTFPERWGKSLHALMLQRLKMRYDPEEGDIKFLREYQLTPVQPSGRLFKIDRLSWDAPLFPNAPGFASFKECSDWMSKFHFPKYAFVDPGGRDSHGIAISVMGQVFGKYLLFEARVITEGINAAVRELYEICEIWDVMEIGVEANFRQEETDMDILDEKLFNYCTYKKKNPGMYRPVRPYTNTGEKIRRISVHFGSMLGYKIDPVCFFVNPGIHAKEQFITEYRNFPEDEKTLGYDLLDASASVEIHYFKGEGEMFGTGEDGAESKDSTSWKNDLGGYDDGIAGA